MGEHVSDNPFSCSAPWRHAHRRHGGFECHGGAFASPDRAALTRERISPLFFLSYTVVPLSTIAFPHITIFCLTARRLAQFKRTVIMYPICILAIWLPCVFLGVAANAMHDVPRIEEKLQARSALAASAGLTEPERSALRRAAAGDDVILVMLERYAPIWMAGLLGAGIMAAVMASDSQILALSTMFTEDVFAFYGGRERFGESIQVQTGRLFVVLLTVMAYVIALRFRNPSSTLRSSSRSRAMRRSRRCSSRRYSGRGDGAPRRGALVGFAVVYTARVPGALARAA
jgi:Na+/proline symporter